MEEAIRPEKGGVSELGNLDAELSAIGQEATRQGNQLCYDGGDCVDDKKRKRRCGARQPGEADYPTHIYQKRRQWSWRRRGDSDPYGSVSSQKARDPYKWTRDDVDFRAGCY